MVTENMLILWPVISWCLFVYPKGQTIMGKSHQLNFGTAQIESENWKLSYKRRLNGKSTRRLKLLREYNNIWVFVTIHWKVPILEVMEWRLLTMVFIWSDGRWAGLDFDVMIAGTIGTLPKCSELPTAKFWGERVVQCVTRPGWQSPF